MRLPLVIGYHLIWTAYGWWLPNDPRGSGSHVIRNDVLKALGELHYGRKRIQPASTVVGKFQERSSGLLTHPRQLFDANQITMIGDAVGDVIGQRKYTCYAFVIMPDHAHILIRKHRDKAEEMTEHLQWASRDQLDALSPPFRYHPVWSINGWKVFLDNPQEVRRTIEYINENPLKAGLPPQHWNFVKDYDNWPLHPGHDPNSPWARRLRGSR